MSTLNPTKRQELITRINTVGVIVWIEKEIHNSTDKEEKQLQLEDLTDTEISSLGSDVLWGLTDGNILTEDRDCLVNWIKK